MDLKINKGIFRVALVLTIALIYVSAFPSSTVAQQSESPDQPVTESEIVVKDLDSPSDFFDFKRR